MTTYIRVNIWPVTTVTTANLGPPPHVFDRHCISGAEQAQGRARHETVLRVHESHLRAPLDRARMNRCSFTCCNCSVPDDMTQSVILYRRFASLCFSSCAPSLTNQVVWNRLSHLRRLLCQRRVRHFVTPLTKCGLGMSPFCPPLLLLLISGGSPPLHE